MKETGFSRVSKSLMLRQIEKEVESSPLFFITQHNRIPAATLDSLRRKLQGAQSRYLVVKNTLGKRALKNKDLGNFGDSITGPCGIVVGGGDPVALSKILMDFAKANEGFKVQIGRMEGQAVGAEQVKALANLPPKEVLIAKVVGGIQAPISRFVGVLSGTLRQMVTILDAIAKKKSQG